MNPNCLLPVGRMLILWALAALPAVSLRADPAADARRRATLEAIHQIENPRELIRPGLYGELGAYQFRRTTWEMHTKAPFGMAINRSVSDQVALLHYDWISRGLAAAGKPVTPYHVALAWNAGLRSAISGRAPPSALAYAERAANLTVALERERLGPQVMVR